jgi:DNA-directed RNA polymerase, subunit K/omega
MLKPSANIIRSPHKSHYSLVIAVAKRAREITEDEYVNNIEQIDKPVDRAVQDFVAGKYTIVEPEDIDG